MASTFFDFTPQSPGLAERMSIVKSGLIEDQAEHRYEVAQIRKEAQNYLRKPTYPSPMSEPPRSISRAPREPVEKVDFSDSENEEAAPAVTPKARKEGKKPNPARSLMKPAKAKSQATKLEQKKTTPAKATHNPFAKKKDNTPKQSILNRSNEGLCAEIVCC